METALTWHQETILETGANTVLSSLSSQMELRPREGAVLLSLGIYPGALRLPRSKFPYLPGNRNNMLQLKLELCCVTAAGWRKHPSCTLIL